MRSWFPHLPAIGARRPALFRRANAAVRTRTARVGLAVLALLIASTSTALVLRGKAHAAAADATPHVWLHYDYLAPDPDGNTFAPNPAAIQLVVDAYERHGIKLEVDPEHTEIPYAEFMSMGTGPNTPLEVGVLAARVQYFHPTANHPWHYALFGDRIDPSYGYHIGGQAELPGDNFIISMGQLNLFYRRLGQDWGNRAVGGTVMHELGHNLGLNHGGDRYDYTNWKPNYLSVMNYSFQLTGIPYAATPGSSTVAGYRLDYSDVALPTLDMAHLDETLGVQGGPTDTDITRWFTYDQAYPFGGTGPTSGPLDWNEDGNVSDRDVKVALNCFPCSPPPLGPEYYYQLTGFDDWAAIRAYLAGTRDPGPKTIETDGGFEGASEEPTITGISPTSGPGSGGTAVTITGAHLGKIVLVMFGQAQAAQFTIVDDHTITAVTPSPCGGGCTVDVTVVSAAGLPNPAVSADQFTFTNVYPVFAGVSPTSGPPGTTITITGQNFTGATCVGVIEASCNWNFSVLSDSTITTVVPAGISPGLVHLEVGDQYATTYDTLHGAFTITPPPTPVITSVSPTSGPATGGTTLLIKGSGFSGATGVSVGSPAASFTVIDDSTISAVTPNVLTAAAGQLYGTVDVRVTTPGGTSAITSFDQFTYLAPAGTPTPTPPPTPTPLPSPPPTLSDFTPSSGPIGTLVTLTGANLTIPGNPQVLFTGCGAAPTIPATPQADGTLTVTVPACAQTGPLTVITAGGSATSAQSFMVT